MNTLRGNTTLDSSVIIEYMMGTGLGRIVKEYFENLKPTERVYCSLYSIAEIFYVLCRLKGGEFAMEKLNVLLNSHVIEVNHSMEMALETGRLKCERAISIADCSCISTAKLTRSRAVFAQKEKELSREMGKKGFDVEILVLADLEKDKRGGI